MHPEAVVVAPDSGSVKVAQAFADMLGAGFAVVAKRRLSATQVASSHLVGDVKGRDCVLVDDLTTTASTLAQAAERVAEAGAGGIYAAVSHCCLTLDGLDTLRRSPIRQMFVTDSVPIPSELRDPKVVVLSVARLLGEAIRRIHEGQSVSSLFRLEAAHNL
jgi:ribose-phosphate pyrophosphokinase